MSSAFLGHSAYKTALLFKNKFKKNNNLLNIM